MTKTISPNWAGNSGFYCHAFVAERFPSTRLDLILSKASAPCLDFDYWDLGFICDL
jgi:hypothetical protein